MNTEPDRSIATEGVSAGPGVLLVGLPERTGPFRTVLDGSIAVSEIAPTGASPSFELRGANPLTIIISSDTSPEIAASIIDRARTEDSDVAVIVRFGGNWSRSVARRVGPASDPAVDAGDRERALCDLADLIIATSLLQLEDLCWRYTIDPDRVRMVPEPVIPTHGGLVDHRLGRFAAPGMVTEESLHGMLIEAFAQVGDLPETAELVLVDGGPDVERISQMGEEHGIRVLVPGDTHGGELLASCCASLHPDLSHGGPRAVLDAMALGVPCIVAEQHGLSEVVEHGSTGLRCPAKGDAFAHVMLGLLSDPEWAISIGAAAARAVEARYGPAAVLAAEIEAHRVAHRIARHKEAA
ncbi:MAG: glycosyltransferase family 4 protein [Planctomycetota bacterium]